MTARFLPLLASAIVLAAPVAAPAAEGKVQVKLLATGVLPDGKIAQVGSASVTLPAGTDTAASEW